ncbi:hypothetical protein DQ04_11481010, partial [Trypanosoma grayi]|uniref:hypothetical protein n=1 Tax=Trypanosoma grayi TaxID=71804 RepID=UPI0004F44AA9
MARQDDGTAPSMRLTDPLRVVELSNNFVQLLGIDRRAAEALEPVFAAHCEQMLPLGGVSSNNNNNNNTGANRSSGCLEPLSTRFAPRSVVLTRQGSLFVLKRSGRRNGVIVERLELGAYLPRQKRKKQQHQHQQIRSSSITRGDKRDSQGFLAASVQEIPPPVRIDVTVDETPFPNGMQAICISASTPARRSELQWPASPTDVQSASAAATSPHRTVGMPSPSPLSRVAAHGKMREMRVRVVLALQFYARHGLLASALAVRIKQTAAHFGHLPVVTFSLSARNMTLQLARQHMTRIAAAQPPSHHQQQQQRRLRHGAAARVAAWASGMLA